MNVEVKRRQTATFFTAEKENVQMLMKLIQSCNQLCMFLSVAQIVDSLPELSYAVTERDLNVSEVGTSRQPPPERLLQSMWRGDLTLRTGDAINGEMIREVIENVSNSTRVAGIWQKSGRFFRTRPQNDSLGWQFQVSKEQSLGCHFAQNETIVPVRSFALPCLC